MQLQTKKNPSFLKIRMEMPSLSMWNFRASSSDQELAKAEIYHLAGRARSATILGSALEFGEMGIGGDFTYLSIIEFRGGPGPMLRVRNR